LNALIKAMSDEELIEFMGATYWLDLVRKHLSESDWLPDVRGEMREYLLGVQVD
jgi:hypothetical protein